LAGLTQLRVEIVVNGDLASIDNAHIHARLDGVIQKHGVHRLAHPLVSTERKGQVRDATGHVRAWQVIADPASSFDESKPVAVMFLHARRNGKDVWIENNVLG